MIAGGRSGGPNQPLCEALRRAANGRRAGPLGPAMVHAEGTRPMYDKSAGNGMGAARSYLMRRRCSLEMAS